MCGIVGAVCSGQVTPILLEGLKRLAYRGYDSAGIAVLNPQTQDIDRIRVEGKVSNLEELLQKSLVEGSIGIAHTRWATHGVPSERNAHPIASHQEVAVVHNGIIENYESFKQMLLQQGYTFTSDTDTEVAAHLLHSYLKTEDLLSASRRLAHVLEGAFALAILYKKEPHRIIAIRKGPPLVIGLGKEANFIASDNLALLPFTNQFIYIQDEELADIQKTQVTLYDLEGNVVKRPIHTSTLDKNSVEKGSYPHYMLKEIFEQSTAVENTLQGRVNKSYVVETVFGQKITACLDSLKQVQISACGTSFHAGLVGRYWLEGLAKIPCQVEIASELRYRETVIRPNTLFTVLSQSGETADTLASLVQAKGLGYQNSLAICNVPESTLVREADFSILTHAGAEIGVASTKGFTTQLVALMLSTLMIGRRHGLDPIVEEKIVHALRKLPEHINQLMCLDERIQQLAELFIDKTHALFLGRGVLYPIAMEGALKLKELSYIHASAYAGGELKHGPLALVDTNMPVVVVAPNGRLLDKLKSNVQEVRARGGQLIIFCDEASQFKGLDATLIEMPVADEILAPILYTIPLQLLAYHVAVVKGTDVDQPRNLAKSVTVE